MRLSHTSLVGAKHMAMLPVGMMNQKPQENMFNRTGIPMNREEIHLLFRIEKVRLALFVRAKLSQLVLIVLLQAPGVLAVVLQSSPAQTRVLTSSLAAVVRVLVVILHQAITLLEMQFGYPTTQVQV